jgi:hypothetical protein
MTADLTMRPIVRGFVRCQRHFPTPIFGERRLETGRLLFAILPTSETYHDVTTGNP